MYVGLDFTDKSAEEILSFISNQPGFNPDEFALFQQQLLEHQQQQQHNGGTAPDPSSVMFDFGSHNY